MAIDEKMTTRREQAQETRKKLLESALKLFAENGYANTHVRDINRNIDMADGLIYHYFPGGKKELLQVLITEHVEQLMTDLKQRNKLLRNLPIEDFLEQIYRNADETFTQHLDIFKILFKESTLYDFVEQDQVKMLFHGTQSWLPDFLMERAKAGEIREMDYESAAQVLKCVTMNHFLMKLTDIGPGHLSNPEHRKKLIEYQISLWKNSQP